MGRADRLDQVGRRVLVDVRQGGDDHGVGVRQPVEPAVRLQQEPADPDGVRAAHPDVVPGAWQVGRGGAEDLVGQSQLEVQHPVGGGDCDGARGRAHVGNCTGRVVPDTGH